MIVNDYTSFSSLPFEISANILSFISFYDIFQNKMTSVSYDIHNILNCLLQISIDEVCISRKNDILKYIEQGKLENKDTQLYIFKPNIRTSVQNRLFNIMKKQKPDVNCIFIANPYTNVISPLLKLTQYKIVLLMCKSDNIETMTFEDNYIPKTRVSKSKKNPSYIYPKQ
jgi:hypothetical protein